MTKLTEESGWPEHESHIFQCDCIDKHFFFIEWDDDPDFRYMTISREWRPVTWRDRIKDCYKILRNKEYMQDAVILNTENVAALKKVLEDK